MARPCVLLLLALCSSASASLRAGTALVDVSPREFPVIVNGMFEERVSSVLTDPVHARAIVLDDGQTKVAIVIVDNLMMPTALLDPDRAVEPRFIAYTAVTTDNQSLYGLITTESPASLTIKQLDATEVTLPRQNLKSLTSSNRSLMPLGFETLSHQDIANLISYLQGN